MATRLLYSGEVSFEQELRCIAAFPLDLGIRLKRMIKDIQISRSNAFDQNDNCDILTSLIWPVPNDLPPYSHHDLPEGMQRFVGEFEKLYLKQHPKQRLSWAHQLSRMTLSYTAPNSRIYELSCTFPQGMLLLKLQSTEEISFGDLPESLKMGRRDVYRHLKVRQILFGYAIYLYFTAIMLYWAHFLQSRH